jgi:hypothetical protein
VQQGEESFIGVVQFIYDSESKSEDHHHDTNCKKYEGVFGRNTFSCMPLSSIFVNDDVTMSHSTRKCTSATSFYKADIVMYLKIMGIAVNKKINEK